MPEVIKSIEEMENMFRVAILSILKIDIDSIGAKKRIRFPWGSSFFNDNGSAPSWQRDEDTCVIYELPRDGSYNRQRDIYYINDEESSDLIRVDEHTDIHSVMFANYGPNAYESARDIRDGLNLPDINEYFRKNNFYLVPDLPALQRVPELVNGQWWNRVDFTAVFYEYVRRESKVKTIEHVNIKATAISKGKELTEYVKSEN